MAELNFGEHDFVDVEELVDDFDIFTGLLLVPCLEFIEQSFIDVVCPIVDFEGVFPVGGTANHGRPEKQSCKSREEFFHFFELDLAVLMLMIIRRMSTKMKISVIIGRISGVRPPLRASA